jgi:hypothetical protein
LIAGSTKGVEIDGREGLQSQNLWRIIILERAAIGTMVFTNGYVAARGGLRGEKWVGLKPLFPCARNHALAQGHDPGSYEGGANAKGAYA